VSDFISAIQQENSGDAIFSGDIHFSGEIKTAKLFQSFIASLNLDWSKFLSQHFGKFFAHNIVSVVTKASDTAKKWNEQTQQDIPEYLQHEISVTPSQNEVDIFLQEVDQVRSQADRIQARIDRLNQNNGLDSDV
jgi:ubiquinone biosynthesis protein UbiJ